MFDSPARVIEISHQRLFTGALRRAIEIRDRTCTHPDCTVPAERSDIDHRIPWNAGGPTTQTNGPADCPFHDHQRQKQPDLDDP